MTASSYRTLKDPTPTAEQMFDHDWGLDRRRWHRDRLSDIGRLSARYDEICDLDLHGLIILV